VSVLLKPRWLALHAFTVFVVVSCAALAYWQFGRAGGGNGRSFGYALQWPAIGVFGVGVWVWLCRDGVRVARHGDAAHEDGNDGGDERDDPEPPPGWRTPVPVIDAERDPELAAYNAMLTRLHEKDELRDQAFHDKVFQDKDGR
jgi:hypothetical protein